MQSLFVFQIDNVYVPEIYSCKIPNLLQLIHVSFHSDLSCALKIKSIKQHKLSFTPNKKLSNYHQKSYHWHVIPSSNDDDHKSQSQQSSPFPS